MSALECALCPFALEMLREEKRLRDSVETETAKILAAADKGYRVDLDITKFDVVNVETYPELEDVDAVLITGSSKSHQHAP